MKKPRTFEEAIEILSTAKDEAEMDLMAEKMGFGGAWFRIGDCLDMSKPEDAAIVAAEQAAAEAEGQATP